MTQDEIIEMYLQVSKKLCNDTEWCWAGVGEPLQMFAKLVAAKALAQRTEPKVCCQQYDTCLEPCTPRGRHLAQRTWVGLTDDEISNMFDDWPFKAGEFARAIEAKLKERNT